VSVVYKEVQKKAGKRSDEKIKVKRGKIM